MSNVEASKPIRRIVVLGGGSAGFLAAFAIKKHLPDISLTVVRSTSMGVIGVGEGTIWSVVNFLHRYLELDPVRFHKACKPSIKLGIHYLWGPRPFFNYTFAPQLSAPLKGTRLPRGYFCQENFEYADLASALMTHNKVCLTKPNGEPQLPPSFAYHLENQCFVAYLEELAREWEIETVDDIVADVVQDDTGIRSLQLKSGNTIDGDLFVDCSGFRAELIGKALQEPIIDFSDTLFCDSAIFGGWERTPDDIYHPYTTAETMDAGWSWRIEHDEVVNRGYVYCSAFISADEAEAEFRRKNPKVESTRGVKFKPTARRRLWVKNVVALGNSAGFVEPLEATAIGMICDGALNLVRGLESAGGVVSPAVRDAYNRIQTENWRLIRDFLAIHYRFNTRLDTPFWRACINDTPLGGAQKYVDFYLDVGPDFSLIHTDLKRDFFDAEGYLSMLVGQQVPYRRKVQMSLKDKHAWRVHKNNLRDLTFNAMDMFEYAAAVRGEGVSDSANVSVNDFYRQTANLGELSWH